MSSHYRAISGNQQFRTGYRRMTTAKKSRRSAGIIRCGTDPQIALRQAVVATTLATFFLSLPFVLNSTLPVTSAKSV